MSSETAFTIEQVAKTYQLYDKPQDRLKQMLMRGRRQYFSEFQALKPLSFSVSKGEVLGVVGRNGAGKSTLLQLICGTLTPTTGKVHVHGRIAALLELGAGFNPQFSGRDNIFLSASIMGISKQEVAAKLDDIIDFAGVREFIDQPVATYSSGMYVRLAFSVATSVEPDILIIDEALSVGDGDFARRSFERIMEMKERGATILFCSHSLYQIEVLCSQAIWLEKGEVVSIGSPDQIVPQYQAFLDLLANNPDAKPTDIGRVHTPQSTENTPPKSGQYARIMGVTASTPEQQGHTLDIVSCQTDLALTICVKSTLEDEIPQVAIVVHNTAGQLISSCSAWASGIQPDIDAQGEAQINVQFPKLPLLKGTYYVGVLLFCQRGIFLYDEADPVVTLQVTQSNQERGIVMLPHIWQSQTSASNKNLNKEIARQPSDRWQVRPAQDSDFPQLKQLFQETFKTPLEDELWHWKYKHAQSPGYIVLEGEQAVAFSGGAPRQGLSHGQPATFVQLGDVMVDRRQRGVLTKTGPFYRSIYHYAADKIGPNKDYAFAFGFPNKRHLKIGERQGLYEATDRILEEKWPAQTDTKLTLTPWQGEAAYSKVIDQLWQAMRPHLNHCLTGLKDEAWWSYRYLEKPNDQYHVCLISDPKTPEDYLGLVALKDHPDGDIAELLDFVCEPQRASYIVAAAQAFAQQQQRHAVMAWLTHSVHQWLEGTGGHIEPTDVFVPGNAHNDPDYLALSKGNWWLMGGDSDFR